MVSLIAAPKYNRQLQFVCPTRSFLFVDIRSMIHPSRSSRSFLISYNNNNNRLLFWMLSNIIIFYALSEEEGVMIIIFCGEWNSVVAILENSNKPLLLLLLLRLSLFRSNNITDNDHICEKAQMRITIKGRTRVAVCFYLGDFCFNLFSRPDCVSAAVD